MQKHRLTGRSLTRPGSHSPWSGGGHGLAAAAEQRARIDVVETLGNPDEDTWEDDQLDLFDRIVTIEEIREIPAADFAVLQRYLPVINA